MKTAKTGLFIFALSWFLAIAEVKYFGWNSYPQSSAEWFCIALCVAVFSFSLWLIVQGFSQLKTA